MRSSWRSVVAAVAVVGVAVAACGDSSEPSSLAGRSNRAGAGSSSGSSGGNTTGDPDAANGGADGGPASVQEGGAEAGPVTPPGSLTCTSCHGDANRTGIAGADANVKVAPPKGSKGETATSTRAVGAHQAHVNKSELIASPLACTQCHVVPAANNHSNGIAELTFGTLAKTGNTTPAFNGTTCTASYCHGNFPGGDTAAAPAWTGAPMTCTSCHGGPPATGDHRRGAHDIACSNCHGTGYSSTTVNKALHMNGVKNAGGAGSNITQYNPATRVCTSACHGTETW